MKESLQVVWLVRQLGGAGSQIWLGPLPVDWGVAVGVRAQQRNNSVCQYSP